MTDKEQNLIRQEVSANHPDASLNIFTERGPLILVSKTADVRTMMVELVWSDKKEYYNKHKIDL